MFLLCDMNANAQQIIKSSDTNDFRIGDSNDTYYIYDDLGLLRFVLSPSYQEEANLEKYGYEYRYDQRGRCVWKRLPGCEYLSVYYHDLRGQVLASKQTMPDDALLSQNMTYSFTKQPLEIISEIFKNGISTTVTQTNSYNKHNDKIETMTLKVGNVTRTVSSYSYNDISRLLSIKRSGNVLRGYDFAYDGLNRLEESTYAEGAGMSQNKNRYSENILSYSPNGSIERLQRYGKKNNGTFGLIDDLTYSYNGNQIKAISDKAGSLLYDGSFDFKDGANADVEYFYDTNGALIKDLNKGISNIEYDVLGNLYGHAYFYELKQKNPSIEPSHTFGVVGYVKEFDSYFNEVVSCPVFGKNNTDLEEKITIVEQ